MGHRQRRPEQHALLDAHADQPADGRQAGRRLDVGRLRRHGHRTGDAGGQGRPAVHHHRVARQCLQRENRRDGVESRDRHAGGRCAAQRGQPDPSGRPESRRHRGRRRAGICRPVQQPGHRAAREDRRGGVGRVRRDRAGAGGPGRLGRAGLRERHGSRRHRRRHRIPRQGRRARGAKRAQGVGVVRRRRSGRPGIQDLAEGHRRVEDGRRRGLGGRRGGSRPGPGLFRHRQRRAAIRRRHPRRRQPVSLLRRRARDQDRQAAVALPDDPPRHLGSRHRGVAGAVRHADRRTRAQGRSRRCAPTATSSCSIARPASR